jgi:hypothetical protein
MRAANEQVSAGKDGVGSGCTSNWDYVTITGVSTLDAAEKFNQLNRSNNP